MPEDKEKKPITFKISKDLHMKMKIYSAQKSIKMADIAQLAITRLLEGKK